MSTPTPLVSILMPVFNCEAYLNESVPSLLKQSYENFELLIIDDGSTDKSLDILKDFAKQDKRIQVYTQENIGITKTLNKLIEYSKGDFLARMDADDRAFPHRLNAQVEYLKDNPTTTAVGSSYELINEIGQPITVIKLPQKHDQIDTLHLEGHTSMSHPAIMMRKKSVVEVGGYDENIPTAQDIDLWLRLAEIGLLANLPDPLIQYRVHNQSISEKKKDLQTHCINLSRKKAWDRRGIKTPFKEVNSDWRPDDSTNSRYLHLLKYGWMAWNSGNKKTCQTYVLRAIRLRPIAISTWKLAFFGLLRQPKGR